MALSSGMLVFLVAVSVVALFVVGMSLTIIFKGHYMDSEIGTNRHMQQRGIRCASQQIREEEAALRGESTGEVCTDGSCSTCATPCGADDTLKPEATTPRSDSSASGMK